MSDSLFTFGILVREFVRGVLESLRPLAEDGVVGVVGGAGSVIWSSSSPRTVSPWRGMTPRGLSIYREGVCVCACTQTCVIMVCIYACVHNVTRKVETLTRMYIFESDL